MEPPIRPYNPNGPGGPRPPVARAGERTEAALALPAGSAVSESSLAMRVESRRGARLVADVIEVDTTTPRDDLSELSDLSDPLEVADDLSVAPPDEPTPRRTRRRATARAPEDAPHPRVKVAAKPPAKVATKRGAAGARSETAPPVVVAAVAPVAPISDGARPMARIQADDQRDVTTSDSGASAARHVAAEASAQPKVIEAGPVVGVADFEDIFTRFQTPLTNFVFRLVGNREQAYDLTQDVFVKAYRALSAGTTIQAAARSSWLYRIASNTATDALRRRRLISWLPLSLFNEDRGVGAGMPGMDLPNSQQGPSEEALNNSMSAFASGYDGGRFEQRVADREVVQRVLRRLPEKYAKCLLLYEYEGFSCAEIAEVLSVSPSAVKMRLMRARERFITLYREEVNG